MSRVALVLALLLVAAAPAAAGIPEYEQGTTVLRVSADLVLRAALDDDSGVCVGFDGQLNCPCGHHENLDYDAWASDTVSAADRPPVPIAGATSARVAVVEYGFRDPRAARVRIDTAPAAAGLRGQLARARYFAGALPDFPMTRRLYAADGTLLDVENQLDTGVTVDPPPPAGQVRLLGGAGWRLIVHPEGQPAPIRGDAAYAIPHVCAGIGGPGRTCTFAETPFPRDELAPACGPNGHAVFYGLAPRAADVPRTARLTDGRRVAVRSRALPAALGAPGVHAYAVPLPPGVGLRGFDRGPASTAPPSTVEHGCGGLGGAVSVYSYVREGGEGPRIGGDAIVPAAGERVFVADRGAELCVALGRPATEGDCRLTSDGINDWVPALPASRTRVGGAVDARVPAVRVGLSDGRFVTVPTVAAAPYAGRFAPYVRVFAYRAPAGRKVRTVAPLDPRGRALTAARFDEPPGADRYGTIGRARVLVRARGARGTLRLASAPLRPAATRARCTFVVHGALPRPGAECPAPGDWWNELDGWVDCAARAAVLTADVSRRITGIRARLAGGGTAAGVIRPAPGSRVAVLVPPPDRVVTAVELLGRGGRVARRYPTRLPPATRHCGYAFGLEHDVALPQLPR